MLESDARKPTPKWSNLRVLAEFARPHLPSLLLGLVLALCGSAATLATPMVTKWVLDTLDTGASLQGPILTLIVLLVVGAVLGCAQWIVLGTAAEKVVFDARSSLVRRFLAATVPSLQSRSVGELVTRVTSDTLLLREAASSAAVNILNAAALTIGTIVLMGVLDLPLLGVTMVAIVFASILFAVLMPRISAAEARTQESLGKLGGVLEGGLRAIRTVKVSLAEDRVGALVTNNAADAKKHAVTAVRVSATAWTVAWTAIQGSIIAILGFGAWRVADGEMAVSTLIAFLLYAFTLMGPVSELAQNVTSVQSGIAAAIRIREMQSMPTETHDVALGVVQKTDPVAPLIELRNVTVSYHGSTEPALSDVSLVIPQRGHMAIVGPSGAGKTTLLSTVLRFVEPGAGEVLLRGVGYNALDHRAVRESLAYVEQETPVVPGTIRENVVFSHPDATDDEVQAVLRLLRLDDAIEALPNGLDTALTATSLSGGQRQRIAMARAVLRPSALLLLDEATAQVDTLTEAAIVDAINERARTGAVVTIAHRLSTVRDADWIVVMEAGRIRNIGNHDELMNKDDLYRDMVVAGRLDHSEALLEDC
ncbi:ABC transporter ATP-binding protein [Rhodococcus sp. (in: high G+C Gram-positive bacteria)]|uniref:ABC transporter ATP-binding protein n=1 Tax=Rhodococcus sp. TaxID=1831 RepID=UPI0015F297FA|nr:ABC transporter ATP-binding protein [Rhodococcus sp. (in: high G+C Gram-positive bacteria)]